MVLGPHGPTVSVRVVLPALLALEGRDIDVEPVLTAAGLASGDVADPNGRVAKTAADKLWLAAERAADTETFGFDAADSVGRGHFDVLEYVVRNQPTLAEATATLRRFGQLAEETMQLRVIDHDEEVRLVFQQSDGHPLPRAWSQMRLSALCRILGEILGAPLGLLSAAFAHPAPANANIDPYITAFGVQPTFGAAEDRITLTRSVWEAPLQGADPALAAALGRFAQHLAADHRADANFVSVVRSTVARALAQGSVNAQTVASALSTSPRTLRRRLAVEGANFRDLVEGVRADLATEYLNRDELSFDDIALLLGYSDATAFHRAFRRWSGETAAEFRRRRRPR